MRSREIADELQTALTLHQQGRLEQAEAVYQAILNRDPNHFDAQCLLGVIASQRKNFAAAIGLFNRALKLNPNSTAAHSGAGNALAALGRHEEAAASFDRALAIDPGQPEVLNNRGNALLVLKRHDEALESYNRGLIIRPAAAEILYNRGNLLFELGRTEEALADYDRALAVKPAYPEALHKRGAALRELRRVAEALASYESALAIRPDFAEALNDRGNALLELKRHGDALASYERAMTVRPGFAEALYNSGTTLCSLGRHAEAARQFTQLLNIEPDFAYAKGELLHSQLHCCDWNDYAHHVEQIESDILAGKRAATPFAFLSVSESPPAQLQCAKIYRGHKIPVSARALWTGERYRHKKIRVAYLSADFHSHATTHLTAELFERHDQSRFETHAISFGPDNQDDMRSRLQGAFTHFIDVRKRSDREVAILLRKLEIDVAVDLKGYTQDSRPRIMAFRPGPIQVNYLGYPATMGADFIDYILADRFTVPEVESGFYTEKVVHLPDMYQPSDTKRRISQHTPTRAAAGLPQTGFIFCSFVANYKIVPAVFDSWMRLLAQVKNSVLWLLAGNEDAVRNLRRRAEMRGIVPERLVFAPRMRPEDHLARHRLADLFLDTLPINAHTTASDALWAGLPVVTCLGASFAGRVAGSLLNALGLPELITDTREDYEALALNLARDANRLASLRAKLAQNRCTHPLFDTDRLRRHIESAFETMLERCRRGEPPAGFTVAPCDHLTAGHAQAGAPAPADMTRLIVLMNAERFEELEIKSREVLAGQANCGVVWQMLGVALTARGENALDALQTAARLLPNDAGAHNNLGNALARLGRVDDALASYRQALLLSPNLAEAHNNLARAYLDLGQLDSAVASCGRAVQLKPRYADAHETLGNALLGLGKLEQASASYRQALKIKPNFADAHRNLGLALRLHGHTAEADASCRRALEIDPHSAATFVILADSNADRGQFAEAEALLRQAIAIEPESPEAWAGIVRLRKMTGGDAAWLAQAQRIVQQPLPARKEVQLRYAIGKYFDDVRDFEQAFNNFWRANELTKLHRPKYDGPRLTRIVDRTTHTYDRQWLSSTGINAPDTSRPVFIVGMLRSGTTLAEQILASHPAVFAAGELGFWSGASAAHQAAALDGEAGGAILRTLAADYLRLLQELSPSALRVVDKMPTNFGFLGLIHAALPKARIIHMRRNPLDTCLSIYFQHFESAVSYANDLQDLAHYYSEYVRLMKHWQSTLPREAILDVPYEALVNDQEAWSRKMLEFIGLPWEPRCLDFYQTSRTVITASKWQVRQKITGSSVGRWRHYEKYLGPLQRLLELEPL
jgi:predicted O-linked N-acetylglucosamine transferase (SPINDLY family)